MTEAEIMEQAQVFASAWSFVDGPFDTGEGMAQAEAEKTALMHMIKTLVCERDEADRRAGAAERKLAGMEAQATTSRRWLDDARARAGYDKNVSFDEVFDDLLRAKGERDTYRQSHECPPRSDPAGFLQYSVNALHDAALFKNACRIATGAPVVRYLIANTAGRLDGAEKALRHQSLCSFYVASILGLGDVDDVRRGGIGEALYQAVHARTQELTDYMDEAIGFPVKSPPITTRSGPRSLRNSTNWPCLHCVRIMGNP